MLKEQESHGYCTCHYCSGRLLYVLSRAGEMVNCPQCGMETVLFIPGRTQPCAQEKYDLRVKKLEWEASATGVRYLVGEVVNESSSELGWAKIEFILYSRGDAPVGAASDALTHFRPGETWKFRAPVFQRAAVRATLRTVCCEFGKSQQTKFRGVDFTPDFFQRPVPAVSA